MTSWDPGACSGTGIHVPIGRPAAASGFRGVSGFSRVGDDWIYRWLLERRLPAARPRQ
jgi:hypothetical protein